MISGAVPVCLQKIEVQKRTEGDGMENTDVDAVSESVSTSDTSRSSLIDRLIYRPKDGSASVTPPDIKGQLVHLLPKNVTPVKKEGHLINIIGGKEPKFIPYEPYKAAVKPIIPYGKHKRKKSVRMTEVHRIKSGDVGGVKEETTVKRISTDNSSLDHALNFPGVNDSLLIPASDVDAINNISHELEKIQCDSEGDRKGLEDELKRLKEENEQLESQLKFQAQVNGELKNLLVAAMGEDLETRVHLLTEDKLHLARALLNSAQKLSTHQEQTEYLASQCEVWRSKFLASSLMVEDLAKWKAALCQKASELQETMKHILDERAKVRESLIHVHRELTLLCDSFDLTDLKGGRRISGMKSSNVVDLASIVNTLSYDLRLQLLGDIPSTFACPDLKGLESSTVPERHAEQLLLHPLALFGQPDAACNAVLGAAVALGVGQIHSTPAPACCSHCSGEIKLM